MDGTIAPKSVERIWPGLEPGSGIVRVRRLVVTADDFGIGPMTSRGILDLAHAGRVTCSVLLVNSPHAESSVQIWRREGRPMELGWHPCLTLDGPVSRPGEVPSLVDRDGRFFRLGAFATRLLTGRVRPAEIRREYQAQYARFLDLVCDRPVVVNAHHHLHTFPLVGSALIDVLTRNLDRPYVRRVREPLSTLCRISGSRVKRIVLTMLGRIASRSLDRAGFPDNDWMAGVSDNQSVNDPEFFARWLARIPGRNVELMCHPGEYDSTLLGRDGSIADGGISRRVKELELLRHDTFPEACALAGFTLSPPSALIANSAGSQRHG